MVNSNLKIDIRRKKILEILRRNGKVYVSELSETLGATPVTIRTDLAALESEGHLIRMSGGAINSQQNTAVSPVDTNLQQQYSEKKSIAVSVARFLNDGSTLFINSGSTTKIIAEELKRRKNLNIVTNSLAVATILGDHPSFCVILLGGEINSQYGFTYGGDAQEQLNRYQADWAILSVDSICAQSGITTFHAEEAVIDRMMINCAQKTMIAADYTKIGRAGFSRVCECSSPIQLITNVNAPEEHISSIMETGITVKLV
ncbi:MAG: DeoR/GlpR transcriptional regulator [Clostridia bacterium]|nr:DeoR/GlpR transcriptional regulator [Clostridia bacterium]